MAIQKTTDKDLVDQLRAEQETDRIYRQSLQAMLGEREALIRMLVRGFMAQERVRMYEEDGEEVPF